MTLCQPNLNSPFGFGQIWLTECYNSLQYIISCRIPILPPPLFQNLPVESDGNIGIDAGCDTDDLHEANQLAHEATEEPPGGGIYSNHHEKRFFLKKKEMDKFRFWDGMSTHYISVDQC